MLRADAPSSPSPTAAYPAEKARGGQIVLMTHAPGWAFITGQAGAVVLLLILAFLK
jgi:hypothetical protein